MVSVLEYREGSAVVCPRDEGKRSVLETVERTVRVLREDVNASGFLVIVQCLRLSVAPREGRDSLQEISFRINVPDL